MSTYRILLAFRRFSGVVETVVGGAPEQAASQRRDVAGSKLDALSQAPSPGPSPQPKGENGVLRTSYATQSENGVL